MLDRKPYWVMAVVCSLLVSACSGDDGSGLLGLLDASPDGGNTGGNGSGAGGRGSGGGGAGGSGVSGGGTSGVGGRASGSSGASGGGGIGGRDASSAAGSSGDAGTRDASSDGADGAVSEGGSDAATPGVPGCPQGGYYALAPSGDGCGDLSNAASNQRMDADPSRCTGYFEFDGTTDLGVSSGTLTFARDGGALAVSEVHVGSATMSCTGQATTKSVLLHCSGDGGTCSVELTLKP
jgi:hypothetical protein